MDFLALHERTGERRADGLSLSAPLTQKHISGSFREATVDEDFKRPIRAKGANWRISPLLCALGYQTHVCLCSGGSLALSSGCFSSSSSSSLGKGFLFCMAVILSKGARGIRRLFMDYIVWQAECETAYLLNLLKVISWLIFLRANLATLKGTPHLHIPQKNCRLTLPQCHLTFYGNFKAVSMDYSMAGGLGALFSCRWLWIIVVDWNLCSECWQMFFGCGLNKKNKIKKKLAVTRTHRYVEISWRHVLMNAYHFVIIIIIIIDIFRSLNDLNIWFTQLILNVAYLKCAHIWEGCRNLSVSFLPRAGYGYNVSVAKPVRIIVFKWAVLCPVCIQWKT